MKLTKQLIADKGGISKKTLYLWIKKYHWENLTLKDLHHKVQMLSDTKNTTEVLSTPIRKITQINENLKNQLQEKEKEISRLTEADKENRYQIERLSNQVHHLEGQIKLLNAPKKKKKWWQFWK